MNFTKVREAVGQMDGQYQAKLPMIGKVSGELPGVSYTTEGKRFQKINITDNLGEVQQVKIYLGKKPEMTIAGTYAFLIGPNPYQNNMYYNGFWQADKRVSQAPTTPQPVPQQPAGGQTTVHPPHQANKATDWDAKDLRIARECAIKASVRLAAAEQIPIDMVTKFADGYVNYIYNGLSTSVKPIANEEPPATSNEEPPATDDDVPNW